MTLRIGLSVVLVVLGASNAGEARYIGVKKCAKMCHKAEKKGAQLKKWQSLRHSKAYATLATPKAKEVAKKAGVEGNPQKADACLKCHVAAFGVKAELIDSTFKAEDGVQCEACHGPGSKYMKLNIMKSKEKSLAAGLVEQTKEVCVKCHNPKSPTYKEFDFEAAKKKIAHPTPPKPAPAK